MGICLKKLSQRLLAIATASFSPFQSGVGTTITCSPKDVNVRAKESFIRTESHVHKVVRKINGLS